MLLKSVKDFEDFYRVGKRFVRHYGTNYKGYYVTGASTVRRDFLREKVVESSLEVEAHYIQIKVVPQKTSRQASGIRQKAYK